MRNRLLINLIVAIIAILSYIAGYDQALTKLADDMYFGRATLRDNRLIMEIRMRRFVCGGKPC